MPIRVSLERIPSPFCESEYEAIEEIPVATVATAYDCPKTGKAYVLVINEALYFGDKMNHSLLCPNQLRANGIRVDDCPRQFDETSSHSIYVPEHDLTLPLELRGVISGVNTRLPTEAELEDLATHVALTSDLEWDPNASSFAANEPDHVFEDGDAGDVRVVNECNSFKSVDCQFSLELQASNDRHLLARRLIAAVKVNMSMGTRHVDAVIRGETTSVVNPETLARLWLVGLDTARNTLRVTTQMGVRTIKHPAQRRFRTALPYLRYPHLKGTWYADTLFFNLKSVRGFNCAHVIGNGIGFTRFYPMVSKADAHLSLKAFIQEVGIMEHLVVDGDPTMAYKEWRKTIQEYRIKQTTTEPYSPWQNRAELDVREVKRGVRRFVKRSRSPRRLWCFLGEHVTALRGYTAYDSIGLKGRCAAEFAVGYTPDISLWIQHAWYDNVWYRDADGESKIGKWLGVANGIGGGDCFWLLPMSARPIARSTVWNITIDELAGAAVKEAIRALDSSIDSKIGDRLNEPTIDLDGGDDVDDGYRGNLVAWFDDADDDELAEEVGVPNVDEYTPKTFDEYLKAFVMVPKGDEILKAQVVSRRKDHNGNPIGRSSSNPVLDTRQYVVEFEDGAQEHYAANLIAENMYTQVDKQGKEFALMSEIVDHASDATAIGADDGFYLDRYGKTKPKMTTRGWKLLVEWKDGNTSKARDLMLRSLNEQISSYYDHLPNISENTKI